ncbi:S-adenosyl-L-methionine-dependent methyltransferase [Echria macrotheca]|uniref:Ubiquinone biosynthesis O-methyltransferase, mitochondrial n=1 Tax=Echria macrotheca TaxID=438768 RepID=A0AAJ0BCX9_9PEZI|nr:S-adenosyl-L-methionine-dependent methyltransferase [Echria macrotheca]
MLRHARQSVGIRPITTGSPLSRPILAARRDHRPLPASPGRRTIPTRHHSSSSSSSVNPSEVSHFTALASTWWDPHGPSRILHLMNPLRHDFITRCLASSSSSSSSSSRTPPPLRYLDVGCGGGIFAESAARLPTTSSVIAIDPTPSILAVARSHARRDPSLSSKLEYLDATIETLPASDEKYQNFDVVSCFEVVEHVDNPAAFLERCGQRVRPGGWLVLSTIARTWTSWLTTNFVAEDLLGIVPKGTHDWDKYINEDELRAFFGKREGWGVPVVVGVVYVPGLGWKEVKGSEKVGNYFFGVQRVG